MAKKSFLNAVSENTALKEKSGVSAVFTATAKEVEPAQEPKNIKSVLLVEQDSAELRQSFIVMADDLDKLKDFVYHKKLTENPLYSQKEALHEAFNLLFAQVKNIPDRPESVKRQERKRNESIRKKRAIK